MKRYLSTEEIAEKWGISARRVRKLCQKKRVKGVKKEGNMYLIPANAEKPVDLRQYYSMDREKRKTKLFYEMDSYQRSIYESCKLSSLSFMGKSFNVNLICDLYCTEGEEEINPRMVSYILDHPNNKMYPPLITDSVNNCCETIVQTRKLANKLGKRYEISIAFLGDLYSMLFGVELIGLEIYPHILKEDQKSFMIKKLDSKILKYKKSNCHPIEKAVILFLEVIECSPFDDRTLSVAAVLLNFLLMRSGYPMIDLKFSKNDLFYKRWRSYIYKGNTYPMIEYVVRMLKVSIGIQIMNRYEFALKYSK